MQETIELKAFIEKLRTGKSDERLDAIRKIRAFKDPEGLDQLLRYREDEDLEVRQTVIEALQNFLHPKVEKALEEALFDEEWEIQWAAMKSLGTLWNENALNKLGDKLPEKRIAGLESLTKKAESRFLKPILAILDDELEEVQDLALLSLGSFSACLGAAEMEEAIKYVKGMCRRASPERLAIINETLTQLGNSEQRRQAHSEKAHQLQCDVCKQVLPYSFLKKVGSWRKEKTYLCQFHFEEYVEKVAPFEGKLKICKMCKSHRPKVELVEGACPSCRTSRYEALSMGNVNQFRCTHCHKQKPKREQAPVNPYGLPICSRCAYKVTQQSANPPFLTSNAVQFLKKAQESGYFLCEKRREFLPIENRGIGTSFRDKCYSKSAAARMK